MSWVQEAENAETAEDWRGRERHPKKYRPTRKNQETFWSN